jgi:hypothetical protein
MVYQGTKERQNRQHVKSIHKSEQIRQAVNLHSNERNQERGALSGSGILEKSYWSAPKTEISF